MDERMREIRVGEVVQAFALAESMGGSIAIVDGGRGLTMVWGTFSDADEPNAALGEAAEAFDRSRTIGPLIAELEGLTETEEGREILLEAKRRFDERD